MADRNKMNDTESTQYLLKLLRTKCDIIREWTNKLRLKADVREQNMLNIIASQADQIMSIANDYSEGNLSLQTEVPDENGDIQLYRGTPLTEEELQEFEKEDNEITKKMREQGIPEGRIYSHIKDKPKEPMATVPNEPVAKDHLAGETTPEEDALISQAIKNALQGVM